MKLGAGPFHDEPFFSLSEIFRYTGRALQVARHVNSSMYFLFSSIRDDWCTGGLSPGGLATENYEGLYHFKGMNPF